jgi:hypothetical protein
MLSTNPTMDHPSRRVAASGYEGRFDKPDAASGLKDCIGTGLLTLCVGFVGLGCRGKITYEVEVRPLSRQHPQIVVMSVITVIPEMKSLT